MTYNTSALALLLAAALVGGCATTPRVPVVTNNASPEANDNVVDHEAIQLTAACEPSPSDQVIQPSQFDAVPRRLPTVGNVAPTPIDLATALASIDGQHPIVGIARWRTEQSLAQLDAARVLWLPILQVGASYHRLDGNLQASDGAILDVNRSSLQAGLGAGAVGAGPTFQPGLVAQFHLVDALYQPRIAERRAWANGHTATAATHDQLLAAGVAHQQLLAAQQQLAIAEDNQLRINDLASLTANFASAGEGLQSDADRLATEALLAESARLAAEERVIAASARLAEAISASPGSQFTCAEPTLVPLDLIPAQSVGASLVSTGLSNRPELKAAQCLVAEACERLRREQSAPLVPSVLLGMTYGGFGGGLGDTVADFNDRAEFNALAVWQVRNLGFGESAARRDNAAMVQQSRFEQVRLMDQVAREVLEAQGQVAARAGRIAATQKAIAVAATSYDQNLARIEQAQGLPIEALQAAGSLNAARASYATAVADYNEAQLRLYRALGWPLAL